eukprot:TRINITY_DN1233_c0_g1_i1.p1 TRINITY_DN1233_c0_g1~~TRINITY_DN1233_c0_g1_i1.p1  ORF type:complete len:592 (+),score=128.51 TRINITY_DN1233_c0_g1_i1:121-1776(+)
MKRDTQRGDHGRLWLCYAALVAARAAMVLATGYVHPDEWFQAPEITAGAVFGLEHTVTPWEWDPAFPCRTIVIPAITTGLPFVALREVGRLLMGDTAWAVTTRTLLYAPRLWMFCLSLLSDCAISLICRRHPRSFPLWPCLVCYASAWPVLLLSSRPLSNTAESILFSIALWAVLTLDSAAPTLALFKCFAAGVLAGAGMFCRPTFAFFSCLLPFYVLHVCGFSVFTWKLHLTWTNVRRVVQWAATAAVGVAAACFCFVAGDSYFFAGYGKLFEWPPVLTPLNFARYNANASNLAQHGLHPRYTHALVNLPLMFGPAALAVASAVASWLWSAKSRSAAMTVERLALCACVASGLALLSFVPHQEPRFLAPLAMPLALAAAPAFARAGALRRTSWIALAVAPALYFGLLHQAGIVPAIAHVDAAQNALQQLLPDAHTDVIFFHTYMPPRHLFVAGAATGNPPHVIEMSNHTAAELRERVEASTSAGACIYVVVPATLAEHVEYAFLLGGCSAHVEAEFLHLTNEDPPTDWHTLFALLRLRVYSVLCNRVTPS